MEQEIWKDIAEFEGYYQVSNLGNVRSVDRLLNCGNHRGIRKGRELKQKEDKHGYMNVCLSKSQKSKTVRTHRLVAMMFIDNPDNKPYVNHIDGNKTNNCVTNLEWCTSAENCFHARQTGLIDVEKMKEISRRNFKKGWGHNKQKVVQLSDITGEVLGIYESIEEAKEKCGINASHITQCCNGKRHTAGGFMWMRYKNYKEGQRFSLFEDRKKGKLTPRQRKEIAQKYANGSKMKNLCEEYAVSRATIRKAMNDNGVKSDKCRGVFYDINLEVLLEELKEGKTNEELARKYCCPKNLISVRKYKFKKEGRLV